MATYTPEPREYELMVLLSPELGDEALETEMQRISDQITGTGAEILSSKSTTPWGRRRMAYPIQNQQDAFYVLYSISSQPGGLDPAERDLKLNGNVLRYLLIRQEKTEFDADESEETTEPASEAESGDESAEPAAEAEPATDAAGDSVEESATEGEDAADETAEEPSTATAEGSEDEQV